MEKEYLSFMQETEIQARLNDAEVARLVLALLKHPTAPYMLGESVLFRLAELIYENYGKD